MSAPSLLDLSLYSDLREPNIVKAQFILSQTKIYTLEFDHNITMSELKIMIQRAAHLRSNNFLLFSNGVEFSNYNNETFVSLFPGEKLVIFTLEIKSDEESNEMELSLQKNDPCNLHKDKFLLYYCFQCGRSICSECFTEGAHQGHKIQDKCFYLLPSKLLVDKLFDNWSKNPYEDYKFLEDQGLAELTANINKLIFGNIMKALTNFQNKIIKIIEQYNYINSQSFDVIRNSVRDIKVYCIKLLDNLKEKMNIKNIVNNEDIFLDFDKAYKKLGNLQKNNLHFNYQSYQKFNKQIPALIKNLVNDLNDINDILLFNLNNILNDQRYENIINQIQIKEVKGLQQEEIYKEVTSHIKEKYDDFKKTNLNINNNNNILDNKISCPEEEMNSNNIQKDQMIKITTTKEKKEIDAQSEIVSKGNIQSDDLHYPKSKINNLSKNEIIENQKDNKNKEEFNAINNIFEGKKETKIISQETSLPLLLNSIEKEIENELANFNKIKDDENVSSLQKIKQMTKIFSKMVKFFTFNKIKKEKNAFEIIPHLYIGSISCASNLEELKSKKITHILCCGDELKLFFPDQFKNRFNR